MENLGEDDTRQMAYKMFLAKKKQQRMKAILGSYEKGSFSATERKNDAVQEEDSWRHDVSFLAPFRWGLASCGHNKPFPEDVGSLNWEVSWEKNAPEATQGTGARPAAGEPDPRGASVGTP